MKIGMVLDRDFPPDIRVEKEVAALAAAGHEVSILVYGRPRHQAHLDRPIDGLTITRIPRHPAWRRAWNSLRFARTFRDGRWAAELRQFVLARKLEALHVHDLPLVPTALELARAHGIPVIADLHENYPALAGLWLDATSPFRRMYLPSELRWAALERRVLPQCDRVVVVVDEARQRVIAECGVQPDRVLTVMNVEDPDRFRPAGPDATLPPAWENRLVILYTGGSGHHRGLETAVDALPLIASQIPQSLLVLAGITPPHDSKLRRQAQALGVQSHLEIMPWQSSDRIPELISAAHICLVPHLRNRHTDTTIPHKLFQYMLLGKPVIVSDCAPLKRIVEETAAGMIFTSGDSVSLARQLQLLLDDRALMAAMGERGRSAAAGPCAWKHEAAKLCALYDNLTTSS